MFQIESALASSKTNAFPITGEAQESAEETLSVLAKMDGEDQNDADELSKILTRPWLDGLLAAHDHISAFKSVTQFNAEDALFERVNFWSQDQYILFLGDSTKCENLLYFAWNELCSV